MGYFPLPPGALLVGDERCLFDRDMGAGIGRIESRPPIDSMGVGIGLIESRPPNRWQLKIFPYKYYFCTLQDILKYGI